MTKIKPLKAVLYNTEKIGNLSSVTCPPYDIISPERQKYYHDLSPHNFIHILLGRDVPGEDKYSRAADYFQDWLRQGILIQDEKPAIYFYNQQFNIKGEKRVRSGYIALLRLEDKGSSVFGHENTRIEPKEDRLRLLKSVKANLSPIFLVFADKKRTIQFIQEKFANQKKPFIDIQDDEKTVHRLWRVDDPAILGKIQLDIQKEDVFIADGHHRYEVSCLYREQLKQKAGNFTGEEDFNYTLAYFTNINSHGLSVLPIHRLVKLGAKNNITDLLSGLKEFFHIEEFKDKVRFFFLMEKAGMQEHVIGMYHGNNYRLLRLKNVKMLDKMIPDKSSAYRSLDVAVFNYIVLKKAMGLNTDENIEYIQHAEELIERVDNSTSLAAFFLNPVKIEQITKVALAKEKMPPKSTYFYPKVLSGLVINKFNE